MSKPIFVIDTSTLVSAVLSPRSFAQQSLERILNIGVFVQSLATLDELKNVLEREKFDKYITSEERTRFFAALIKEILLVEVTVSINDCRDPKDNKFLELAVSANAQIIISGDNDLLSLNPFRGIQIVTPGDFLEE